MNSFEQALFNIGKLALIGSIAITACGPSARSLPSPTSVPTPSPTILRTSPPTQQPTQPSTTKPAPSSSQSLPSRPPTPSPTLNPTFSLVDYGLTSHFSLGIRVKNNSNSEISLSSPNNKCVVDTRDKTLAKCGDVQIAKLKGGDASNIYVSSSQIEPQKIVTIKDENCRPVQSSCIYRIGSGPGALDVDVNIPEPLNALRSGRIDPLTAESSLVRYNLDSSESRTISSNDNELYSWVFSRKLGQVFSSNFIEVRNGTAEYHGSLALYSGLRRSDLIGNTAQLLTLLNRLSGGKVSNINSVRLYQVSVTGREEAVAVLRYTIPLELENPERGLWKITGKSLEKIPNTFPSALPLRTGFSVVPASDLGANSGGVSRPVGMIYSTNEFKNRSKDERAVYIDAITRYDYGSRGFQNNLERLIETIYDATKLSDMKLTPLEFFGGVIEGYQSAKSIYSKTQALVNPHLFYGNLDWRVPNN